MGELLTRRREMVVSGEEEDTSIIFELAEPRTFTGVQYASTGVQLSSLSSTDFTYSATFTTSRTSGTGRVFTNAATNPTLSIYIGVYNGRLAMYAVWGFNTKLNYIDDADFSKRIKVVFRHKPSMSTKNDLHVSYYNAGGELIIKHSSTVMNTGSFPTSSSILYGGQNGNVGQSIEGTMYECVIRERALTDAEIATFLNS